MAIKLTQTQKKLLEDMADRGVELTRTGSAFLLSWPTVCVAGASVLRKVRGRTVAPLIKAGLLKQGVADVKGRFYEITAAGRARCEH